MHNNNTYWALASYNKMKYGNFMQTKKLNKAIYEE